MLSVRSEDGTKIAYEQTGSGPPLMLVDGALCHRANGPARALARELSSGFTVYTFDRRGRGQSGDVAPYAVEREVEDIGALTQKIGKPTYVCGISSGAALALEAANRGVEIHGLALFEAPFIVDDSRAPLPDDYRERLDRFLSAGQRADAVRLFLKVVGVPGLLLALMPMLPAWRKLKAVAHTLPYDAAVMAGTQQGKPLPDARWRLLTTPTLAIGGGKSPAWMQNAVRALAEALPNATQCTLPGQTHMVKAKALAPALTAFFQTSGAHDPVHSESMPGSPERLRTA